MKQLLDKSTKKTLWNPICKRLIAAFLSAYALSVTFHAPFARFHFEGGVDYVIASVYELLGDYNFSFLLLLVLCGVYYSFLEEKLGRPKKPVPVWLPVFFSLTLLIGRSYQQIGTWGFCFGSPVNFVKFVLTLAGGSLLLGSILNGLCVVMEKARWVDKEPHFWSSHGFGKAFVILCAAYLPFLILAFPGNVCWDAAGQIQQAVGESGYSLHHPLAHTLLMGGAVRLGEGLLGSREAGLFCYMLLQLAGLAAALASTIGVLARRGLRKGLLWALLLIYCVTPVYSNMASTALKDVPYASAVTGYVICLALLLEEPRLLKSLRFITGFVLLQVCVILLRNNGIYVILLSGLVILVFFLKKYGWREAGGLFLGALAGSLAAGELVLLLLAQACGASAGSLGEALSIPFQQTARYLQAYGDQVTEEERDAIEAVLGDMQELAGRYDPDSADPVKAQFRKSASTGDILAYLKQWAHGLFRHPGVYVEAFLAHTYGWFSPEVNNSIRYEAEYDVVSRGGLFPGAEKLLIFYYRFAARFTPLGILENVAFAVWGLFFLTCWQKSHGRGRLAAAGLPLWISFLVCMASPGFLHHARYGFPILFSILFLFGFTVTAKGNEGR